MFSRVIVSRPAPRATRHHHALAALLGLLALAPAHGMLSPSLPRLATRHAVTASSASAASPSAQRCIRRGQRCGAARCQVFPSDFARQSDQEEDEAGDAARAVLRARRAVGGTVPPDERPSQEWSEGVLDGSGAPFWWREEADGSGEVEVRLSDPALPSAGEEVGEDGAEGGVSEEEEAWKLGALPDGDPFWWRENEEESDGVEISLVAPAEMVISQMEELTAAAST